MKYLHCPDCIDQGQRGMYDVYVDDFGDLHVSCVDHELLHGGPFMSFQNDTIAHALSEIAQVPCEHCGDNGKGESH